MRQSPQATRKPRGFTLIELAATLAISGLLALVGWPLLTRQQASAAVVAATSRTVAALQAAREQALASGHPVTVCPSADGRRCGFGGSQWMAFENLPPGLDSTREAADRLLQTWQLPAGVQASGTRGFATYQPSARAATTLTLRFCHRRHPQISRSVIVSQTGRARVSRPAPASTPAPRQCP